METEVRLPSQPPPELVLDSACTSPFITAPSSPSFFPRASYRDPQLQNIQNDNSYDFEFDFSGFSQKRLSVSAADDLFFQGQIKPLKPPPRDQILTVGSPRSTKSPRTVLIEAISPKNKDFDPSQDAIKQSQRENRGNKPRVSDILAEDEPDLLKTETDKNTTGMFSFPKSVWKRYKKWKLKYLLLFRNASEGRKDEIARGSMKNSKSFEKDDKSSSFRSTESSGSGPRRKGSLSAHYMINRAVQEEMKKKTLLPYKHGLMGMGCLGLEQPVHDLVRNFGSNRG